MRSSSGSAVRYARVVSAALGMLLVGIAAIPAYAKTVREDQWHLDAMKADEMWRTSTGKGVTVAVIDTGVDKNFPDLVGQVVPGRDLSTEKPGDENTDPDGHGTSMAVLIAGTGKRSGGKGIFGLAPGAKILPIRMPEADEGPSGLSFDVDMYTGALSEAIRHAVDSGAKVINISLGTRVTGDNVTDAVKYALDEGSLVFSAVGNSGDDGNLVYYPAATPGVVGVAAVDKSIKATKESQHGPQVDLAAPGAEIMTPCKIGSGICSSDGTSDASALASASAALIWSKYPDWTNNQVLRVMLNTAGKAKNGDDSNTYLGHGVVRPRIALTAPGDPGPADEYPLDDLVEAEPSEGPSPEAAPTPASTAGDSEAKDKQPVAAASDDGGDAGLWVGLGIGAAVLLGGAVAIPVVRSRRRASADAVPSAPPAPSYAPQQYQYQQQSVHPGQGPMPGAAPVDPRNAAPGPRA
ncbi:type VII secretion-associated serine protease mycosin [Streptomyces sp. NPDC093085]|uniref:type VII secretion-associated serine protease mycosin n=1 Tax=Streptomyces sp. NPDC093085 TaxID=3155068 RepID=UPI003429F7F8